MITVSGLRQNREKQTDPSLAWFMFHKIYRVYSDIRKKEEINAAILLTSILEHEEANKVKEELEDSRDKDDNNQPILQKMIIPSDINYIQPRATQVWNCGEVGFDPSKIWSKVICTYKFFQGERMWKVQTGERATFWYALLVFTQADGQ